LVKLLFRKSLDKLTFGSSAFVLCNIQQNQTINKPCTHYCHYLSLSLSLCLIAVVTNSGFHCWRSDNAVALDTDFWPNTQASEIVGVIGICWCGCAL
jgi:hypothetical protein